MSVFLHLYLILLSRLLDFLTCLCGIKLSFWDPHHEPWHKRDVNEDNQHSGLWYKSKWWCHFSVCMHESDIFCLLVCCEVLVQSLFNMESRKPSSAAGLVSTFQEAHFTFFIKCGNSTVQTVRNPRPNSIHPPQPCPPYLCTTDIAVTSDRTKIPVWTIQLNRTIPRNSVSAVLSHPPGTN